MARRITDIIFSIDPNNLVLVIIGLGSLNLAILYITGFFVHLGESHILGVYIPVSSNTDYLVLGGVFVYTTLQSLVFLVCSPSLIDLKLVCYPLSLCIFLVLTEVSKYISGRNYRIYRFLLSERVCHGLIQTLFIIFLLIFSYLWIFYLNSFFQYKEMLFPLKADELQDISEKHKENIKAIDSAREISPSEKKSQKDMLLKSVLDFRTKNTPLEFKFKNWEKWQRLAFRNKSGLFGFVVLTGILYVLSLLIIIRQLSADDQAQQSSPRYLLVLKRGHSVFGILLSVIALFQLCSLPFIYGITLTDCKYPVAEIVECEIPCLKEKQVFLLGEKSDKLYFYDYEDLWKVRVVSSDKIQQMDILGRESVFKGWLFP